MHKLEFNAILPATFTSFHEAVGLLPFTVRVHTDPLKLALTL